MAKRNKLTPQSLSRIDLSDLRDKCLVNAKDLFEEAQILFTAKKFSRSAFLFLTSLEECMKSKIVDSLLNKNISEQKFLQIWLSHKMKLLVQRAHISVYAVDGTDEVITDYSFPVGFEAKVKEFIDLRERSLYVDFSKSVIDFPADVGRIEAIHFRNIAQRAISWQLLGEELERKLKELQLSGN